LVAPFIDSAGISGLLTALLSAMLRGVNVIFLTHDALNIASFTSRAIEELRREAERIGGQLAVYSAEAGSGRDRQTHPLLHSTLVISDNKSVLIGSANLTSHALASNFETGVLLGSDEAMEVAGIVHNLIKSSYVYLAFKTDQTL
jgi:phosphatidylserine/phosphatidylglycerophosphate/cardiolipin synthase-like enzyme